MSRLCINKFRAWLGVSSLLILKLAGRSHVIIALLLISLGYYIGAVNEYRKIIKPIEQVRLK